MAKRGKYVLFYGINTQKILKFPGLYVALNRATVVNSEKWDAKILMVMSPLQREEKKDWTKEEGEPPSGIIWQFLFSKASRSLRKESSWTWKDVEMTLLDLHQKAVRAISHFSDCSLATEPDFMAEDCNKGEAGENSSTDQKHLHEHGGSENRCQKEDGELLRTPWSTWADPVWSFSSEKVSDWKRQTFGEPGWAIYKVVRYQLIQPWFCFWKACPPGISRTFCTLDAVQLLKRHRLFFVAFPIWPAGGAATQLP